MKLKAQEAEGFLQSPRANIRAALLYGADDTQVERARKQLVDRWMGQNTDPFALVTIDSTALKADAGLLRLECQALGFFGGDRVICGRNLGDGLLKAIQPALESLPQRVYLIISAGSLAASSKLRKLFESTTYAVAIPFYAPEAADRVRFVDQTLQDHNLPALSQEADHVLRDWLKELSYGELQQFANKLALYMHSSTATVTDTADVMACLPLSADSMLETVVQHVARGQARDLPTLLAGLDSKQASPSAVLTVVTRHFSRLYKVICAVQGGKSITEGMSTLRPPVFFKQKPSFTQQCQDWPVAALEAALMTLSEAEAALRQGNTYPEQAILERALMRVAMLFPGRS